MRLDFKSDGTRDGQRNAGTVVANSGSDFPWSTLPPVRTSLSSYFSMRNTCYPLHWPGFPETSFCKNTELIKPSLTQVAYLVLDASEGTIEGFDDSDNDSDQEKVCGSVATTMVVSC